MADTRTWLNCSKHPPRVTEDANPYSWKCGKQFELAEAWVKQFVQNKQFFGHDKEDPHGSDIVTSTKITSTMRVPNVPIIRLSLCFFLSLSREQLRIWLEKNPSIHSTWDGSYSMNSAAWWETFGQNASRECLKNHRDASPGSSNRAKAVLPRVLSEHCLRQERNQALSPAPILHLSKAVELSFYFRSGALPGNTVTQSKGRF
ncbi:hypothetical protein Tco_0109001 [Tanacetum coccineum]